MSAKNKPILCISYLLQRNTETFDAVLALVLALTILIVLCRTDDPSENMRHSFASWEDGRSTFSV